MMDRMTLKKLQEARTQVISDEGITNSGHQLVAKWLVTAAINLLQGKDISIELNYALSVTKEAQ